MQEKTWAHVYLSLGSNLGDRESFLYKAIELLRHKGKIQKVSSLYETKPLGVENQPLFLNGAVHITTTQVPETFLQYIHKIERWLGRERVIKWGPRTIDIDVILWGDLTYNSSTLVIPHPLFRGRIFVLKPLAEIAPDVVDPVTKKSMSVLLSGATSSPL